jgi:hypothetical protein
MIVRGSATQGSRGLTAELVQASTPVPGFGFGEVLDRNMGAACAFLGRIESPRRIQMSQNSLEIPYSWALLLHPSLIREEHSHVDVNRVQALQRSECG